jgi:hypothetical protein
LTDFSSECGGLGLLAAIFPFLLDLESRFPRSVCFGAAIRDGNTQNRLLQEGGEWSPPF